MESGRSGSLKIEGARFVVTVDSGRRVIQDGSVVVQDQRITHVGKADDLRSVPAERTIDAAGGVLTPAFVNGHMHISYAHAVRGLFPDDLVGRERLREVFRLQSAMTEEEEYWTSLLAVIELMRSGTVSFVDPGSTKHLDACLQVVRRLRLPGGDRHQPDRPAIGSGAAALRHRRGACGGRRRSSASTTTGSRTGCGRGRCRFPPTPARRSCWRARATWPTSTARARRFTTAVAPGRRATADGVSGGDWRARFERVAGPRHRHRRRGGGGDRPEPGQRGGLPEHGAQGRQRTRSAQAAGAAGAAG